MTAFSCVLTTTLLKICPCRTKPVQTRHQLPKAGQPQLDGMHKHRMGIATLSGHVCLHTPTCLRLVHSQKRKNTQQRVGETRCRSTSRAINIIDGESAGRTWVGPPGVSSQRAEGWEACRTPLQAPVEQAHDIQAARGARGVPGGEPPGQARGVEAVRAGQLRPRLWVGFCRVEVAGGAHPTVSRRAAGVQQRQRGGRG